MTTTTTSTTSLPLDLRTLVVCTCVLYIKFLATTIVQGRKGFAAGTRAPEDKHLPMAKGMPLESSFNFHGSPVPLTVDDVSLNERLARASEDEARWKRIVQNDLECIPLALVVFVVAVAAGGDVHVNAVLVVVFTIARVAHTVSYATKRPHLRMGTWMVGVLSVVAAAIVAVIAAV